MLYRYHFFLSCQQVQKNARYHYALNVTFRSQTHLFLLSFLLPMRLVFIVFDFWVYCTYVQNAAGFDHAVVTLLFLFYIWPLPKAHY